MSKTESLAEKIARLLESEAQPNEMAALFASIEKINHRLDKLENLSSPKSQIPVSRSAHPSLEKFDVAEAIADEIFSGLQKESCCIN